ncbi:2450_t:CDS:2, partial [Diversispora eburnea]
AKSALEFIQDEVKLLRVNFQPASFEDVIPTTKDSNFHVDKLYKVSNKKVKIFLNKMHDVVTIEKVATGTVESKTDTLVDDLLHACIYKVVIPVEYWSELGCGLPDKTTVNVKRWPGRNGHDQVGVLEVLAKIRQFLL